MTYVQPATPGLDSGASMFTVHNFIQTLRCPMVRHNLSLWSLMELVAEVTAN